MICTHPSSRLRHPAGFTLVELLTALFIITIIGAMVVTAVNGVTTTAREARTRSIIATVDSVIQQQYESYRFRPLAVDVPNTFQPFQPPGPTGGGPAEPFEAGYEVLATEAARVRLAMIRDLQRMELPDRFTDITSPPAALRAACNPVLVNNSQVINTRNALASRRMLPVTWFNQNGAGSADNLPARLAAYRDRLSGTQTTEHQGAECLYLILSTSFAAGSPAIEAIPQTNIGDIDGDGMPEILDGWGQPLEFIRWPVGFEDPDQSLGSTLPDGFDLLRADFAYVSTNADQIGTFNDVDSQGRIVPPTSPPTFTRAVTVDLNVYNEQINRSDTTVSAAQALAISARFPWSLRPLVFSVGADGDSGIATNPWVGPNTGDELETFSYQDSTLNWPTDPGTIGESYFGTELPGRDQPVGVGTIGALVFPDPFLRDFIADNGGVTGFNGVVPGQLRPDLSVTDAVTQSADNITSYSLQAVQR